MLGSLEQTEPLSGSATYTRILVSELLLAADPGWFSAALQYSNHGHPQHTNQSKTDDLSWTQINMRESPHRYISVHHILESKFRRRQE